MLELWAHRPKNQIQNPNPTNLDAKKIVNIATFNIRILNTQNQLLEITSSAVDYNIDIICVQEHEYYHSELELKYHDSNNV